MVYKLKDDWFIPDRLKKAVAEHNDAITLRNIKKYVQTGSLPTVVHKPILKEQSEEVEPPLVKAGDIFKVDIPVLKATKPGDIFKNFSINPYAKSTDPDLTAIKPLQKKRKIYINAGDIFRGR